jgi:nifR3 family TIM-barrel protein
MVKVPFERGSLIFAPMEGITEEAYRLTIEELYPDWDKLCTDFLRVPTSGLYTQIHLKKHFGLECLTKNNHVSKTMYQILTSSRSQTLQTVKAINELGFKWIDLNIGCPSNMVCKNQGGAFLLTDLVNLEIILKTIRDTFQGSFTVKMRIGFNDDKNFEKALKLIEDCGANAITIHARTRAQLYQGRANWSYIKKATELVKIPIVANGDIWTVEDIENVFEQTGCHSVMIARGALKKPWLASNFRRSKYQDSQSELRSYINEFFPTYLKHLGKEIFTDEAKLKKCKSVSRFMFDDFEDKTVKGNLLRSEKLEQFLKIIEA